MHETNRQELAERLYQLTTHLVRNSGQSALALIDEIGVRPSQLKALHILAHVEAPITVSRLAELLDASQPTASRTIASLARVGLVACTISESDRRARLVTATAAGHRVIDRLAASRVRDLRVFTDGLSDSAAHRLSAALHQIDLATDEQQLRVEAAA